MENIKEHLTIIRERQKELEREVRERTVGYIMAALGLVAGLAWNDAIKSFIEHLFPLQNNSLLAKFVYAIVITLVVVLLTVYLTRLIKSNKDNS